MYKTEARSPICMKETPFATSRLPYRRSIFVTQI